jgi:hypothetical protein
MVDKRKEMSNDRDYPAINNRPSTLMSKSFPPSNDHESITAFFEGKLFCILFQEKEPRTAHNSLAMSGRTIRAMGETERGSMSRSNARRTGYARLIHARLSSHIAAGHRPALRGSARMRPQEKTSKNNKSETRIARIFTKHGL